MTPSIVQRAVIPLAAGVLLLLLIVFTAPRVVHVDVGSDDVPLTGVHGREDHHGRSFRWTTGAARLDWPGLAGVRPVGVEAELSSFPGRQGDEVVLAAGRVSVRHRMTGGYDVVWLPLSRAADGLALEVRSAHHVAPPDPRRLGVRLDRLSIYNGSPWQALLHIGWLPLAVLVATGAVAWTAGIWAWGGAAWARGRRWIPGGAAVVAVALFLLAGREALLTTSGVRALGAAVLLGLLLAWLLCRREAYSRAAGVQVAGSACAVWLLLVAWTTPYFVDVPRWDIWETVALIDMALTGRFEVATLWSAHNEHRPLPGRLVVIGTALFARWNHWWEYAALVAMPVLQLLLVARFAETLRGATRRVHPAALAASAVFLCSLTLWENWLRGYHVHIFVGAIAPVAALLLLAHRAPTWTRLAGAAALAVLGELSFGTGLLAWPVGALVIVARGGRAWRARLAVWVGVSAVAIALYFPGLPPRAGADGGIALQFGSVKSVARLVVGTVLPLAMPIVYSPETFIGPVSATQVALVLLGGGAVLLAAVLLAWHWHHDVAREGTWIFPGALIAFGLGACLLAGLGRVSMGLYAMTASRYLVFAGCFWTGVLLLLGLSAASGRRWERRAALGAVAACAIAAFTAWPAAVPYMEHDAWAGRQARAQLLSGDVGSAAVVLYPNPIKLDEMRTVLLKHGLSVFRPGQH